ncbi:MAG: hypothetical protein ACLFVU_08555 [Phycisphaerae bacterium]
MAENVQGRDRGKFGHELKVNVTGTSRSHDLTHVGVGVSQVLPILVASLLADSADGDGEPLSDRQHWILDQLRDGVKLTRAWSRRTAASASGKPSGN